MDKRKESELQRITEVHTDRLPAAAGGALVENDLISLELNLDASNFFWYLSNWIDGWPTTEILAKF